MKKFSLFIKCEDHRLEFTPVIGLMLSNKLKTPPSTKNKRRKIDWQEVISETTFCLEVKESSKFTR